MKKQKKIIHLSAPFFFGKEKNNLNRCIKSTFVSTSGNFIEKFTSQIKKITKAKHAVPMVNCTSALQIAIKLLDPKFNDEIIVPTITFVSSVNSIIYNNCRPIFLGVDENFLIDINLIIKFLNENTFQKEGYCYNKKTNNRILALMAVHVFGNSVNLTQKLLKILKSKNIKLIEDAAESLGSYYFQKRKKIHTGLIGDLGCISFNANKIVTSGGGGMVITNSKKYAEKALYLSTQAKDDSMNFIHNEIGYNFRISNLHASIGCAQLENLRKVLLKKKKIFQIYQKKISQINGLKIVKTLTNSISNHWMNVVILEKNRYPLSKSKLVKKFKKNRIEVRSVWHPNHMQKPFINYEQYFANNNLDLIKNSLCLPGSYSLSTTDQYKIIKILE